MFKFYSLKKILSKKAHYNMIIGERTNGKTYAVLEHILKEYVNTGNQGAIIRRFQEDFRGKNGQSMFDGLVNNNVIAKITNYDWTDVYYYGGKWWLCKYEDDKRVNSKEPFCYAFALTNMEHDKSTSYPKIKNVLFDEFLTRKFYLVDEFMVFMNVLSTIIRLDDDVKIFMCGNTVNKHSPYFEEMGLINISHMKQGDIDLYEYGESGLRVAVEFSDSIAKEKPSNTYFAFNNPKLSMITGQGSIWELDIYPHLPKKYNNNDVKLVFYVVFGESIIQGNIIKLGLDSFIYFHMKTTEIKKKNKNIVFDLKPHHERHYHISLISSNNKITNLISSYFKTKKVFYQNNTVGELINNYIKSN